jgi:hypothetical protein
MKTNILNRLAKSNYKVFDFGRGKSIPAKGRHRRNVKKAAKRELDKNISE